ncbi:InlB B-repeat-containing protein [Metabacillus fastidiosus]|uniref:InlB B-repeat-containing protein n=1 Tax=Metabacillus fastidiosus TaxID=1458 RepID=UPI002E20BAA0|nr:InlB B-repeat-containing protein [Metabacillus fastidiosus]
MWKKSKLVFLSSALAFAITSNATNYVAFATEGEESKVTVPTVPTVPQETAPQVTVPQVTEPQVIVPEAPKPENGTPLNQNYVKIIFENRVLFHEQLPTKTMIQVMNASEEVLESEVLSGDMKLELDNPKISKGKMLSYWSIERKGDKLLIMPVLVTEKELSVKFLSEEGGLLLQHNAQTKEIVKSVNKGTNLKDILPEVNPKENHKFTGWFKAVTTEDNKKTKEKVDIDDVKITDSKTEYYALFYPDFNNNNIDDRTEEITVKFVTNSEEKFKDIKTHVGKQIKLPKLKKKDSVFMGWYTDEEYKDKFTGDILTKSLTLYAKWEKAEKVIEDTQGKPITDQDISDQIEQALKERPQDYNSNVNQTPNSNENTSKIPNSNDSKKPNNNTDSNPSVAPNTNNSGFTIVEPSEPSQPAYEGNTGAFKETKYVFANSNIGEDFMVKFFEKDGRFLFSLTLPYGKTIKLYDENENLKEEYAVRQDTSITMDTKEYVNDVSRLAGFDTREVRINSIQITEVFPKIKVESEYSKRLAREEALAMEEIRKADKMKSIYLILSISLAAVVVGIGAYLFIKRRRLAKEM